MKLSVYGVLVALLFSFTNLTAQEVSKCDARLREPPIRFQQWLQSKQMNASQLAMATYVIPVVVHVLHQGDSLGEGFNFSDERIVNQIRTLNEDYRRKEGTPGFKDFTQLRLPAVIQTTK